MTHDNSKSYKITPRPKTRPSQAGFFRNFDPFKRSRGISDCSIEQGLDSIRKTRKLWTEKMYLWEGTLGGKIIHNQ